MPKNMRGKILYPLNSMRVKYPDIFEQQMRKYAGREYLTRYRIPILNCLWNDVLFFSAVNPKEIIDALVAAGGTPFMKINYYRIAPELIDPEKAAIYLYSYDDRVGGADKRNFIPYDPKQLEKISLMPKATIDYYTEMLGRGKCHLLAFYKIPHVLYKKPLDISQGDVVIEEYASR